MEKENNVFLTKIDEDIAREEYFSEREGEPSDEIADDGSAAEADDMIIWQAPEFEHLERSTTWYWASMGIAIVLIAIALWQRNFLFAVFIVIAELAVFMLSGEKPKMWDFTIDEEGVTIENHKTYRYKDITLYDIHEFSDEYHELVLQTKSKIHHYIKIFIRVEDEQRIQDALDKQVKRGEIETTFLDLLERWAGF